MWAARPEEIRSDDNWESQGPATPPGRLHLTGSLPLTGRKWLVVGLAVVVLAGEDASRPAGSALRGAGMRASAVITTGTYPDVLAVPTAAITTANSRTVVTWVTGSSTATTEVDRGSAQ